MVRDQAKILLCVLFCSLYAGAAWADGAVYAMTNALDNNEILVYHRDSNGNLSLAQTVATGGGGSGLQLAGVDSLGSAGGLQLDPQHHLLFAVNTESAAENNGAGAFNQDCQQGTITSFLVASDGTLTFADRVFSGGLFPNSLAISKGGKKEAAVLYVLNAGGPEPPAICHLQPSSANTPNITGFVVNIAGGMLPIASQPIDPGPANAASGVECTSAAAAGWSGLTGAPAADFQCGLNPPSFARTAGQVRFSPNGRQLVVTVKGTNTIYAFRVRSGMAEDPFAIKIANAALPTPALPTPLGVTFDTVGHLLVAELFGTATSIPKGGAGAVSSFTLTRTPSLQAISSDVADGGTAAHAIVLEPISGKFAYVSNNLSASISSYTVGGDGSVTLLNGIAASGAGPNDLATATEAGVSFLYVVDAGSGTVGAFRINGDGSLTAITGGSGLPAGRSAQGLAAY